VLAERLRLASYLGPGAWAHRGLYRTRALPRVDEMLPTKRTFCSSLLNGTPQVMSHGRKMARGTLILSSVLGDGDRNCWDAASFNRRLNQSDGLMADRSSGLQQSVAVCNGEDEKTEGDRARSPKVTCDQQPTRLSAREKGSRGPAAVTQLRNPRVLVWVEEQGAGVHPWRPEEHLVNARHSEP
jgi:hypothetical protein